MNPNGYIGKFFYEVLKSPVLLPKTKKKKLF